MGMPDPVNLFVSYSHKDESLMEELFEFLQPLSMAGKIAIWNDRAIPVGDLWDDRIKQALANAEIIVLLISSSFLASTYINGVEISQAMELRREKGTRIIPVMLRPCDLQSHIVPNERHTIADFKGLPRDMKPITSWSSHEEAWLDVATGLKPVIERILQEKTKPT